LNEKKAWFDAKGRAELRYDKEFNEYCTKLKEEQKELKSVVNGQILSRFPRLMAFKIRTRMQEDR
jgi:hypothetical protein